MSRRAILLAVAASIPGICIAGGSANGDRLALVTYWGDDKVALVDTRGEPGKEEIWAIDVLKAAGCPKPYDVRANRAGSKAYVTCSGGDQIIAIDVVAQMVEWSLKTGSSPRDLQLYDSDRRLIVANSGSDTVSVVDVPNRRVLYDVPVAVQPYGVALANGGRNALVTGWASGDVHVLDLGPTSGSNRGAIKVGLLPYTVVAPGQGSTAYVAANGDHSVVQVDVNRMRVVNRQRVGRNPWSIATNPAGTKMLVANNRSANLSLLPTFNNLPGFTTPRTLSAGVAQLGSMRTARAPKNAALSVDGRTGIFTDLANNQVVVVDTDDGHIIRAINVGKAPYGIELLRP